MLIFTIAISFEIKAGKVTKDKFANIADNEEYKLLLVSSRTLMDNRQFYIKEFDNNYYYNFKSEYRFFKFIEIYVRTRIFNMKIFKENMETIVNTVDTNNLPAYKKLLVEEYWKIPDDKFTEVTEQALTDIKNGAIRLIDIVKLYAYFAHFVEKGLIKYDMKTIKTIFLNGMNISSLTSKYCDDVENELSQIALEEISSEMEEILERFTQLNAKLKDKMYIELAEEVFKSIPMKMENFYDKFAKECMQVPIFKYYDTFQLFQRISCASNEDIVTIRELLIKRANLYKNEIKDEKTFIEELKKVIDDYIRGKDTSIKIVMLEALSKDLGYIIEKYEEE